MISTLQWMPTRMPAIRPSVKVAPTAATSFVPWVPSGRVTT